MVDKRTAGKPVAPRHDRKNEVDEDKGDEVVDEGDREDEGGGLGNIGAVAQPRLAH